MFTSLKSKVKSSNLLYEIYSSYIVRFTYGYMHSKGEVERFIKKLKKDKKSVGYDANKQDLYVFIGDKFEDSTLRKAVFGDIDEGNTDAKCVYYTTRQLKNKKIERFHTLYFAINKLIPLPFKSLWEYQYTTNDIVASEQYNMFVIFMAGAYYQETFSEPVLFRRIDGFSEKTFCKKILYMADPIGKYPYLYYWLPYFDVLTSYSKDDCEKYDMEYIDTPCVQYNFKKTKDEYDIYFRGMEAGRLDIVKHCYDYLNSNGVKCDFYIQSQDKVIHEPGLCVDNSRVSYREMVSEELKSNVLLEVLIPGIGSGATLRCKEAIMYGKKLLSNNPRIKEIEFGNSDNVRYFDRVEDIDVSWILDKNISEYNYDGQYSVDTFFVKLKDAALKRSR